MLGDGMVLVHLDARCPGVRVPLKHVGDPQLRLNLSYRFASHDLHVSHEAVSCTLSFAGALFLCELPLRSIFAATSHVTGEAVLWPEDSPAPEGIAAVASTPAPPPALAPAAEGEPNDAPAARPARRRNHLRLIK